MNTSYEQITEKKNLTELRTGEDGKVTKLRGSAATLGIFRHLGLVLDAPVSLVQSADTAIDDLDLHVMVGDQLTSLSKELARDIQVSVVRVRAAVEVDRLLDQRQRAILELAR